MTNEQRNDLFIHLVEEDGNYDYERNFYGNDYAYNTRKIDLLNKQLKRGKITKEEFEKKYAKIKKKSDEEDDYTPKKTGRKKFDYRRPNKNKPDDSVKKLKNYDRSDTITYGKLSDNNGEKYAHYTEVLLRSDNYNEYKTAFKTMARFLGHPNASAIKISRKGRGNVSHICYDKKTSAGCGANTKLYHTTTVRNLNRLNGMMRAKDGVCYSSKRVYFCKGKPGSRFGGSGATNVGSNTYVYEYIGDPTKACVDHELHGNAVYIETDTSVPVKDVTKEFRK